MDRKIVFVAIFMFMIYNVAALGVTPGRTPFDYSPGEEREVVFTVINSEHKDVGLSISVQGDLNESIVLYEKLFRMGASEEEKKITAKFIMPEKLSPGRHDANIIVSELPAEQQVDGKAVIGAVLAVTTQVSTYVPYPGKYLEGDMKISGGADKKVFVISLLNRGKEPIKRIYATINIYDLSGKKVKVLETNEISMEKTGAAEITSEWYVDVPLGKYVAKVVLNYDQKEVLLEKEFEIGDFVLDLQQIFVKDFELGGIAKFNMIVQNKWNEKISNAYAEMRVFDDSMSEIANMKSATYDIPAGLQTTMVYYWDTKGIKESVYNANVILRYEGKQTQQDLKLDVGKNKIDVIGLGYVISSEPESGSSGIVIILVIVIGFLVLLNLAWFFKFRKKKLGG